MNFFVIIPSIIFTIFATATLTYVSIATMVGPWIAPVIVLMSTILFKFRRIQQSKAETNKDLALIQTVGSVGGIVGIGIGFTLPTLYFLDPVLFNSWIQAPLYFYFIVVALCLSAGGFGIWLARCFAQKFIAQDQLEFPVSQLIYNTITSQSQEKQSQGMFLGFGASWIVCFLRDGLLRIKGLLPHTFYLFRGFLGKELAIAVSPMYWAIGFILGLKIVFPLLVGMFSRYLVLYPLNHHDALLPFRLFPVLSDGDFIMAFCSGLVICELILGLLKYPGIIWSKIKKFSGYNFLAGFNNLKDKTKKSGNGLFKLLLNVEPLTIIALSILFLSYFGFNILGIILMLILIVVFTYQISFLAGKLGLVPFGRFATFTMIPMMLLFRIDYVQITMLCVFFNICAALATDLLFDYKVGQLCGIDFKKIYKYQWLGLVVTSLSIGLILWLLFTNFQIGSAELFAQRSKSRALLIQSVGFDWIVLILGFLYGVLLKKFKVNPTMVFGGILMPNSLTIGLMIGAVISWFTKKSKEKQPFWSGVFAGESMWILISMLLRMFA